MSRYKQVVSGEWYDLEKKWDLQCCQCGLVHTVGMRHSAKMAWRALALLQEELEADGAPLARGAR